MKYNIVFQCCLVMSLDVVAPTLRLPVNAETIRKEREAVGALRLYSRGLNMFMTEKPDPICVIDPILRK